MKKSILLVFLILISSNAVSSQQQQQQQQFQQQQQQMQQQSQQMQQQLHAERARVEKRVEHLLNEYKNSELITLFEVNNTMTSLELEFVELAIENKALRSISYTETANELKQVYSCDTSIGSANLLNAYKYIIKTSTSRTKKIDELCNTYKSVKTSYGFDFYGHSFKDIGILLNKYSSEQYVSKINSCHSENEKLKDLEVSITKDAKKLAKNITLDISDLMPKTMYDKQMMTDRVMMGLELIDELDSVTVIKDNSSRKISFNAKLFGSDISMSMYLDDEKNSLYSIKSTSITEMNYKLGEVQLQAMNEISKANESIQKIEVSKELLNYSYKRLNLGSYLSKDCQDFKYR